MCPAPSEGAEPQQLGAQQWQALDHALAWLFLLGRAIVPSLVEGAEMPRGTSAFRWLFYPLFGVSLALAMYACYRGLSLAVGVLESYYPRFGM